MSSIDDAKASFERIVTQHGGDAYAVTVRDDQIVEAPGTGAVTVTPRFWTRACTMPVPYALQMQDGVGILSGDLQALVAHHADVTFDPKPNMVATVSGPGLGTTGTQFVIQTAPRHPGGFELQLRDGVPAP